MDKQTVAFLNKTRDLIDQNIDIMLNYRQSGHPGGSRSKVPALVSLMLGGAMRWDIRKPEKRFADRFVLGAGHTIPMIYATLAVLNEAMRIRFNETGDARFNPGKRESVLYWEDLTGFRRRGGLSGHAEMDGKTLFLKFNTGPSGHGTGAAAGEALALKRAGAGEVNVFIMEGEGGLTPGVTHEIANSAWGLALDNFHVILDWNDYGIDDHKTSQIVYGTPKEWFESHGWMAFDAGSVDDLEGLSNTLVGMVNSTNPNRVPKALWYKSRKGRGYGKYDNASHGVPHSMNSAAYWETKKEFMAKYGVTFVNVDQAAPSDENALFEEFHKNLEVVAKALAADKALVEYLSDRLVELGDSVPEAIEGVCIDGKVSPFDDPALYDYKAYPAELYLKPGSSAPNRKALADWGAWINAYGHDKYNRPLFVVSSADLSGSTNISGFAGKSGSFDGYGWYERVGTDQGVLLPQGITEFGNAAIMAGIASVNLSEDPRNSYDGFWGATSTYGSFSYLVYGILRLYSQMDQDCDLKLGKIIYVAGHSGPETADDSRTHFGIFSPGVTQLFPKGSIVNLYPWEYNEVPVLLATALKLDKPSIIALHLTRPNVEIPNREAVGMASHFEAAKGAYLIRDYKEGQPKNGTFYVQGTAAAANLLKALPLLEKEGLNCKFVYVASPQLFDLQDKAYKDAMVTDFDRNNSTLITTSAKKLMPEFTFRSESLEYAVSPDYDDRWRTGGTFEEVMEEAHLTPEAIQEGIKRFAGYVAK